MAKSNKVSNKKTTDDYMHEAMEGLSEAVNDNDFRIGRSNRRIRQYHDQLPSNHRNASARDVAETRSADLISNLSSLKREDDVLGGIEKGDFTM